LWLFLLSGFFNKMNFSSRRRRRRRRRIALEFVVKILTSSGCLRWAVELHLLLLVFVSQEPE
jgi:hypothetical protein